MNSNRKKHVIEYYASPPFSHNHSVGDFFRRVWRYNYQIPIDPPPMRKKGEILTDRRVMLVLSSLTYEPMVNSITAGQFVYFFGFEFPFLFLIHILYT